MLCSVTNYMVKLFKPKGFKLRNKGIAKVLGKLEAEAMEHIWKQKTGTVREICDQLSRTRKKGISFNTVMTVMNRLVQKGLLMKQQGMNCYEYKPRLTKEEFLDNISNNIMKGLMKDFKSYVLAHFAENLDSDDLDELIKLREKFSKK